MFCLISIPNVVHKYTSTCYLYWLRSTSINNNMYYIVCIYMYILTLNNGTQVNVIWKVQVFVTWTDLEILVEPHEAGGCEGHGQEQGQRVPKPELGEDQHPDHPLHVHVTRARLQRDRHVTAPWNREKRLSSYKVNYFINFIK